MALKIMVLKRNGKKEPFIPGKLYESILLASQGLSLAESEVDDLFRSVRLEILEDEKKETTSSLIADRVVRLMMEKGVYDPKWFEAAKRYELARIYNNVYGKGNWKDFDPIDLRLTFNAIKVLEARYLLKEPESGRFKETPKMMFKRVARFLASVEKRYGASEQETKYWEEEFFRIMSELKFIPNSPTLMNSETRLGILSACFVIPVRDAMTTSEGEGIMDAVRAQALIFQHGGGTGFDFSELRPEGDVVTSSGGRSSGPLSFMKLFDLNTEVIKQGGKRRGANMGVMHIWHPDIKKFIKAKTGALKDVNLQNFNISVGVYDWFMEAVGKEERIPLINPRKTDLSGVRDSRYYATVRARYRLNEEWVQEIIIDELERNKGSVRLDESLIVTWDEALAIAKTNNAITDWIDARDLFNEITKGAWDSGDPGMLFIDTINRRHPVWYLGKIHATNPCVSGDTLILTPKGWKKAKDIYKEAKNEGIAKGVAINKELLGEGGEASAYKTKLITTVGEEEVYRVTEDEALNLKISSTVEAWIWHIGLKPALKIITREGYEITVTHNHKFLTPKGWKKAKDLKPGDKINIARLHPAFSGYEGSINLDEDVAFALGWLVENGAFNEDYVAWFFNERDKAAEEKVRRGIEKLGGNPTSHTYVLNKARYKVQYNKGSKVYGNVTELMGRAFKRDGERTLPEIVWKMSPRALAAFLKGLFTADSYIDYDKTIRLVNASLKLLKEVQILLTTFGIYSMIRKKGHLDDSHYIIDNEKRAFSDEHYELIIEGYSRKLFKDFIGLENIEKLEKLTLGKTRKDPTWAIIEKITDVGFADFYDFTVPYYHNYIANGLINHNCGEEPLLDWENCNLGSINLEKYVIERTEGPTIDWEGLAKDVRIAIRFLDNVIDANRHPLPQITKANRKTRKVGLGVMGWARMLIKLGIPYDSPDAVYLAWYLAEWIAWNAYSEGVELAREKGPFPAWNFKLYRWLFETTPFESPEKILEIAGIKNKLSERAKRLITSRPPTNWEGVKKRAKLYGLRNATYLSIAPTGSISIIAGTSSSIEPLFALAFIRNVSVGTFLEVDPLFIDELRKLEIDEPEVLETIAETGSVSHIKWIPRRLRRLYRTAHDINPEWHLLHQATWQVWIDAAVSKTVNLRHDEPPETVWRVYMLAWKLGAKGVTIYRDRSKSEQVIYFGVKKERKREEEIPVIKTEKEEIRPILIIDKEKEEREESQKKIPEIITKKANTESHETRLTPGKSRVRLGNGKIKELLVVAEEYAGGCPTCDI